MPKLLNSTALTGDFTANTDQFFIDQSSGRIGIGTTTPGAQIEIEDSSNSTSGLRFSAVGTGNQDNVNMHFQGTAGSAPFYISRAQTGGAEIQLQRDGDIILNGANGDNVGIGTSNPQQRLDVDGNASLRGNVYFGTGTSNYYNGVGGGFAIYTQSTIKQFEVRYGGDTTARTLTLGDRFDTAARNTTKLDVAGDVYGTNNASSIVRFDNTESSVSTTGGEVLQIRHDGASGTGTGALMITFRDLSGSIKGKISSNGTSTSYGTTSDKRLKEDEKDFNALDLISGMQAYDFKWKDYDLREYGMFAQELKDIAPQAVEWDDDNDDDIMSVDYSRLVPILVKAIQELQEEIKLLKN